MNRRQFLEASAAVAMSQALFPGTRPAAAAGRADEPDWSLGWRSVGQDRLAPMALSVEGTLPAEVRGTLFRNGPARLERDGMRYRHWFDGDGMVQQYVIGTQSITHQARYVQTPKYRREQAAGRFVYSAAGTALPNPEPSGNNDTGNTANTALLPWDDELLALWEGGSAWRVDPHSLDTLGRKDWRDDLVHMPFSAHPLRERDGTLWNFGSAPYAGRNGMLYLYRIEPGKGVVAAQPVALPAASYLHSFTMTERFLLFYLGPHNYAHGASTFVDSFKWQPEQGSRILLVDKNDLASHRWLEAPAGFVFHCAHAFERGNEVVAQFCLYPDAGIMQSGMVELLRGPSMADYPEFGRARLATLRLNLHTGTVSADAGDTLLEFPSIDARLRGRATAIFGVGHGDSANPAHSNALVRIDARDGEVTHCDFGDDHIVEEPLFVPRDASPHAGGWLVGTFLDVRREQTGVYVVDSNDLAAGPVAMGRMPRSVPLGFHGCFIGT